LKHPGPVATWQRDEGQSNVFKGHSGRPTPTPQAQPHAAGGFLEGRKTAGRTGPGRLAVERGPPPSAQPRAHLARICAAGPVRVSRQDHPGPQTPPAPPLLEPARTGPPCRARKIAKLPRFIQTREGVRCAQPAPGTDSDPGGSRTRNLRLQVYE
jgi:hypothetical protein